VIIGGAPGVYVAENVDGMGTTWNVHFVDPPSATSYIVSVVCGDLNHDAYVDIVCGVYVSSARNIVIMSYDGTTWNEKLGNLPYFGEYVDFSINDINLDGNQDIVASGGGGADVLLGHGDFNWTLLNKGLSSSSYANFVVDINNNGILDIVDTDGIYETKGLENLFVKGFEIIPSNLPLGEKFALDHGDLNKDGLQDLLAIRESGVIYNSMVVYFNNGDGTWNFYSVPQVSIGDMKDGKIGDMDNDGDLDIVFCSQRWSQNILIVRNAGDGTFPDPPENIYSLPVYPVVPPNRAGRAYTVDLGDYDCDGDLDILSTAMNDSSTPPPDPYEIWLIRNDGGVWTNATLYHSEFMIYDAKFAHIDDDAYLDIVSAGYSGYGIKAFLYDNSSNSWIETGNLPSTPTCRDVDFGDIDCDGAIEILAGMDIYSYDNSTQSWTFTYDFGEACQENVFMDLNFDGKIDVIQLKESWYGGFTVWTNKGNNTWQKGVYQNLDEEYYQVFTAFDYDLDGTKELFFSSPDIGIRVYEVDIEQDKTDVQYLNPQPSSDEWLNDFIVEPRVTISDIEGSGVDGNTIEYAIKTHTQGAFGAWTAFTPIPEDAQEIEVAKQFVFEEGDQNYIKWRAKDLVGNGYIESPAYQILIDISDPYFQNENPSSDSWVNSPSQTLSVEITDEWSGLDAPSIKYKLDTGMGYGEWVSAGETSGGNTLVPSIMAYLSEGTNKIIWKATDKVGHTVISDKYIIKLDTQPTVFKSPYPVDGQWMMTNSIKCSVNIFDSGINGSGVNSTNIQYRYSTNGLFEYGPWIGASDLYEVEDGRQTGIHVNTSTITFFEGTNNYIQYQALDLATNGFTPSPDYRILIDTTPVTFTTPLPGSDDWQASSEMVCYITIEDMDGSGVDGTSTEYWVVKNNPNPDLVKPNWTKAITQISAESVTFNAIVELPDGVYNWIKWRAKDVAGNGFTESIWYQIKVDSTDIYFSNPEPSADEWQTSTQVNSSIILTIDTDSEHLDYSNPQSLQFRYSTSGVLDFGPWNDVSSYSIIDSTTLICKASFTLSDGTDNYVQWRAIENVSEEYTESAPYKINIDTMEITFSNPQPLPHEWQSSGQVVCYITVEDMGGSGVDGTSVEYWLVKNNPNPNSVAPNWTKAITQISAESVTFNAMVGFPDGIHNWIKWRVKDVAGNGHTESNWNQVKVDSTYIYFSNPTPGTDEWQTSTDVTASVVVNIDTDPNNLDYSNPQSLQYRYSTSGVLGFGNWIKVDGFSVIDNSTLVCEAYLSLVDGTDNYVQWRALENVSKGIHSTSSPYQIKVDSTPLTFTNPIPTSNTVNEFLEITCYITIQDSGSAVDGSSIQFRHSISGSDDSSFTDWNSTVSQPNSLLTTISVMIQLENGDDNYLQWSAKDVAGNGPTYSQKYQIKVNFIDSDGDGTSDDKDYDDDNDGVLDTQDKFPLDPDEWQDTDNDGIGDNADNDDDDDGVPDDEDAFPTNSGEYSDWDQDGIGDNADSDDDNDGVPDIQDEFPFDNTEWLDSDDDGVGNNADPDDDNDGRPDNEDALPYNSNEWEDFDGDGVGDNTDSDKDGDGVPNTNDAFAGDPTEWHDTDDDGIGNNLDTDDDNDGFNDTIDEFPLDKKEWSDFDGDGFGDNSDPDKDGDGYPNTNDAFPDDPTEWYDTDDDEIGNNVDTDDDGDGYNDDIDEFPNNQNEWKDTDHDSIGDNADFDDDNDGALDYDDFAPLDSTIQRDPNLIRIWGVEFEIGELVMGIMMAAGAVLLGMVVFTRKKRLYSKYKNRLDECDSVTELNKVNSEVKADMEKERLTSIQLTMLKEQYDGKYMGLRQKELEERLGKLPTRVEDTIREIISDKIITEDEFVGMQRWLSRLRESKDFDSSKKEKIQEVLKDWIDENVAEEGEI